MSARLDEVNDLLQKFEVEPEHVQQVSRLALVLYDQLSALHRLGVAERELLEAAALLHDIGWSKSPTGKRHHKLSYRIIRNYKWKLWGDKDVEMVALVARYHRKADPNDGHHAFSRLRLADQSRVLRLSALLRLADGLDRSHRAAIQKIVCRVTAVRVTLETETDGDLAAERECLERKSRLFKNVFGCEVRLA